LSSAAATTFAAAATATTTFASAATTTSSLATAAAFSTSTSTFLSLDTVVVLVFALLLRELQKRGHAACHCAQLANAHVTNYGCRVGDANIDAWGTASPSDACERLGRQEARAAEHNGGGQETQQHHGAKRECVA
jgi:hypothetical protein